MNTIYILLVSLPNIYKKNYKYNENTGVSIDKYILTKMKVSVSA